MRLRRLAPFAGSALALALAGCASLSTNEDVREATAQSLPPLPEIWAVGGAMPGEVRIGWIAAIGDPVLSELVLEAQANNRDIRAAAANLEAARALVRQARAPLLPQINGSFSGIVYVIRNGVSAGDIREPMHQRPMPARGGENINLTDEQIDKIATFVWSLRKAQ